MTAPTITAALAVAEAAEANGWELQGIEPSETSGKVFTFTRGDLRANVRVSDAGVILDAELTDTQTNVQESVTPRDKGKRETVTGWLSEGAGGVIKATADNPIYLDTVTGLFSHSKDLTREERAIRHRARIDAQLRLRNRKR